MASISEVRAAAPAKPSAEPAHLFQPLEIREVRLRNRIGVSPMCQYSSTDGYASDWHFVHLGSRAVGGAAMVMAEAAAVLPEARISPQDLGIWSDGHIAMLSRIFRFIEDQGAVPAMQLAHAGRKASTEVPWKGLHPLAESEGGWRPIFAPSAVPFSEKYPTPEPLDERGIAHVVEAFAAAARRVREAGAKILEIHSAHGYLLQEFLSPLSNRRKDGYGGSFENRTRLLREVVEAIRGVWPASQPLFVRISSTDWVEGGWTGDDSVELAKQLGPLGVDLIDCSSGANVPEARPPLGPGFQVQFAERVRKESSVLSAAVGLITSPVQADHIVRTGQADLVLLARELLRDPYWPLRAADELRQEGPWPKQYLRAKRT
ncbi:MAG TPA: NADH:flavin oxidoreductase/NADH oxidase [Bryobacteraceae bacterium]|nr:NADH:flavin oxidoreductase/NADH oxidase [Bryobacteraceae bacterium]